MTTFVHYTTQIWFVGITSVLYMFGDMGFIILYTRNSDFLYHFSIAILLKRLPCNFLCGFAYTEVADIHTHTILLLYLNYNVYASLLFASLHHHITLPLPVFGSPLLFIVTHSLPRWFVSSVSLSHCVSCD